MPDIEKLHLEDALEDSPQVTIGLMCQAQVSESGRDHSVYNYSRFYLFE